MFIEDRTLIFIHSSFRVSSTWLWSRFRQAKDTCAYYEIFNENLHTLSRFEAKTSKYNSWHSKHPKEAAYFLEYLPLLMKYKGVKGYEPSMSFDRFIPIGGPQGYISEAEKSYISGLAKHAGRNGKTPVLTACRSLGRLSGIKQEFPGFHIVIYRNLFQQWCSYVEQYECGNPYFLNTVKLTIERNQHDRFIREVFNRWVSAVSELSDPRLFLAFAALHMYLYAYAVDAADLVIDANLLACDQSYQKKMEAIIVKSTGLKVDLSTARNSISACSTILHEPEALRHALLPVLKDFAGVQKDSKGQKFALKILDGVSEEQARYSDHYTRQGLDEITRLRVELRRLTKKLGEASTERDAMLPLGSWKFRRPLRAIRAVFHR